MAMECQTQLDTSIASFKSEARADKRWQAVSGRLREVLTKTRRPQRPNDTEVRCRHRVLLP